MDKIIIYISNYNRIGGVETFVNNFIKRLHTHYDITLMYDNVDTLELVLSIFEYCNFEKIMPKVKYKCDYFICSSAWGYEPYDQIDAKKYIQMVHADYGYYIKGWNFSYNKHKKVTHHVCVGQLVADSFEKATKLKCDAIIYNLLDKNVVPVDKVKGNKLQLITLSRLSGEKGFDRMVKFAEQIPCDYEWNVWGNITGIWAQAIVKKFKHLPKVKFNGITTKPYNEIAKADYLVQLSDTEGYCYSVIEALQMNTPCIITPFTSGNEQIKHKKNGYIIDFEVKNINFEEIINKIPKVDSFVENSTEQDWITFLNKIR
jgi:glycosyltransferase involved in cell wall biosynthesis